MTSISLKLDEGGITGCTNKHSLSLGLWSCGPHVGSQHLKGAASRTEAVATVTAVPPFFQH